MRQRKEKLEAEIQKFMAAIAESGHSKYILEQVAIREKEIAAITDRLLAASPDSMEARLNEIRSFVTKEIYNLRELLNEGAPLAKAELHRHLTEIRMTPSSDGNGWNYVAEGEWDLLGTDAELAPRRQFSDWRLDMVAGVGFEPTTSGL